MPNFENAFNTVCELVKDFKENEHIYLSAKYNESQARKDYIDKFLLEAKKQIQTIKTDRDKTYHESRCADLDHAIDSEVYKLYALTEEEIKIVEGK